MTGLSNLYNQANSVTSNKIVNAMPIQRLIPLMFLFLFLFCYGSFSQLIQYRPYLRSSCTDTLRVIENYILRKDSVSLPSLNFGSTITLPDTGTYTLESPEIINSFVEIKVRINKVGLNSDTLKARDIDEFLFIDSKPPKGMFNGVWLCCHKVCNGHLIEYYNSGAKYFEGDFRKGLPLGRIIYYYESGRVKGISFYNRKGKEIHTQLFKDE